MLDPKPGQLATRLFWPLLAFGLACGGLAQALIVFQPAAFAGHFFRQPLVLAAVHLTSLGLVASIFLGVGVQALPVLFHQDQGGAKAAALGQALFAAGALGLAAFFAGARSWALLGPALTAMAVGLGLLMRRARSGSALATTRTVAWTGLRAALAYLAGLFLFACAMAAGLLSPLLPQDPFSTLILHIHWALWGFAASTVFGLLPKLLRLFRASTGYPAWPLTLAFGTIHLGMALELVAWSLNAPLWRMVASAVFLGAALLFALQLGFLLRASKKLGLDSSLAAQLAAAAWLILAAGLDLAAELRPGDWRLAEVAVYLGLVGFAGGMVLGTLQRIIAVLSWMDRFEVPSATHLVPTAWELVDPRLAWSAPLLHTAGVALGCVGLLQSDPTLLRISALLVGTSIFLVASAAVLSRTRGRAQPFPNGVNPYLS